MIFDIPLAAPATVIAAVSIDIDGTILVQMAAFLLSIPMLHYLLFKPYLKTRELRSENVEGSEEEAGEMVARAEVLQEEYQTKMRKARRDAQDVRESLRDQGLAEQRDIQQEVSDELDAKLQQERAAIEEHVEEARRDIEERAEGLADAMVQKLIPNQG